MDDKNLDLSHLAEALDQLYALDTNTLIEALQHLPKDNIRQIAKALLAHPNTFVRDNAVAELGYCANPADLEAVLAVTRDASWVVRCSAASALGAFPAASAERRLFQLARTDPSSDVRRYAYVALYDLGVDREALGQFVEQRLKRETQTRLKLTAYGVLVRCGRDEYRTQLEHLKLEILMRPSRSQGHLMYLYNFIMEDLDETSSTS